MSIATTLMFVLARTAALQAPARVTSAQAIVDSASQARQSFRAASRAPTTRETLSHLVRATQAWPTQPAYWSAAARVGARLSDTAVVRDAIESLARLHAGAVLSTDSAVRRMAHHPSIERALQRLARSTAPITAGRVVATLPDTTVFAEGVDADPRTDALYVASIKHRTIYEIRADGAIRDLRLSGDARIGSVLGVRVAPDGRTLYATTAGLPVMDQYVAGDSSIAAILRIRIADGRVAARWDVATDGTRHLLGDLAVGSDGAVYATDSYAPALYRLRRGADSLESLRHPLFRSLQGIAPIPGQGRLIVADYSHGLLRVDLATNIVTRIADVPGTTSLGIDGIVWQRGGVIVVQNGMEPARIARFTLDGTQARVVRVDDLDRQPTVADEPTIGTLWRGGFVYVANSQWEKFDDDRRRPGTTLMPTRLLCVPLTRTPRGAQATGAAARNGNRSTASAPPSARTCRVSAAASP